MLHVATEPDRAYGLDALLAEGFSARQIERLVTDGVLPPAHGHAPYGHWYSDLHLAVLRRINRERDERRSILDIRDMLDIGGMP